MNGHPRFFLYIHMEQFIQWLLAIINTAMLVLYLSRVFENEYPVVRPTHRYHDIITSAYLIVIIFYISSQ